MPRARSTSSTATDGARAGDPATPFLAHAAAHVPRVRADLIHRLADIADGRGPGSAERGDADAAAFGLVLVELPALLRFLEDPDPETRRAVVRITPLASLVGEDVGDRLARRYAEDPDGPVRADAFSALAGLAERRRPPRGRGAAVGGRGRRRLRAAGARAGRRHAAGGSRHPVPGGSGRGPRRGERPCRTRQRAAVPRRRSAADRRRGPRPVGAMVRPCSVDSHQIVARTRPMPGGERPRVSTTAAGRSSSR
ncbi:HEAT repeat domain-containing protein [Streptomyces sp. NPDC001549]|uniref:HEAT repeat domain-containing protein n=1 Tax=Streptomyces sp. NPDC001549 TaxID=3364586 RepID=UPI0036A7158F